MRASAAGCRGCRPLPRRIERPAKNGYFSALLAGWPRSGAGTVPVAGMEVFRKSVRHPPRPL